MDAFFNNESTKDVLGLARDRKYVPLNVDVNADFWAYGDQYVVLFFNFRYNTETVVQNATSSRASYPINERWN